MATRPGQVVSQATSPRKPWRASSSIGVSGFSSAIVFVQPIWSSTGTLPVDRNIVKKMPIWRIGPARVSGIR